MTMTLELYCYIAISSKLLRLLQAWYLGYGARDVLEQSCKNLHTKIQVSIYGSSDQRRRVLVLKK